MKINLRGMAIVISAAALAGCGESAPSDKDVQAAMGRQMTQLMGSAAAESQKAEFAKMKVRKCMKAEIGGFTCEVDSPAGGVVTGRFKKESEGWVLAGTGG
jgi:ABC-type glycerol-3-phosphate transport system substrate-binding protein